MLEGWEFIEYYGQDPYIGHKTQKGVYRSVFRCLTPTDAPIVLGSPM